MSLRARGHKSGSALACLLEPGHGVGICRPCVSISLREGGHARPSWYMLPTIKITGGSLAPAPGPDDPVAGNWHVHLRVVRSRASTGPGAWLGTVRSTRAGLRETGVRHG